MKLCVTRRARKHPEIAAALGPVARVLGARGPAGSALAGDFDHILVGCSGGADSVAASCLLARLRTKLGLRITLGHIDHGLRSESAAELEFVHDLARDLECEFVSDRLSLAPGAGLPERARLARRRALEGQARRCGASFIVLAHSATDQAETMLMNLARGCGLEGVSAMSSVDGPRLRPVLTFSRARLRSLATRLYGRWVDDPTNVDETHARVRVRTGVLPILEGLNPQALPHMLRASEDARDAEAALQCWAASEFRARVCAGDEWHLRGFGALPRAVRMRFVRQVCESTGVDLSELRHSVISDIELAMVEAGDSLSEPPATVQGGQNRHLQSLSGPDADPGSPRREPQQLHPFEPPEFQCDPQPPVGPSLACGGVDAQSERSTPRPRPGPKSWDLKPNRRLGIARGRVRIVVGRPKMSNH